MVAEREHLLLLDASGYAYRAHFAMPAAHRADGLPIHAILGFMGMVWRLMDRAEKDPYHYAAAVFDAPGRTFRHKIFADYKKGRERPADLAEQLPLLREAARVLGMEPVELGGFEADDVIATLAARAAFNEIRTTIVSIDKDFLQLVKNDVVEIVDPVQRVRILEADVVKKFGVEPRLVIDVQALCGDAVDNIPGVAGIGMKTAAGLIRRFGSLNGVLKAIDLRGEPLAPRIRSALKRARKNIPMYRRLATLKRDVPIKIDFADLKPKQVREAHLREMLRALGAENRYESLFGGGVVRLTRAADYLKAPFEWWTEELLAKGQKIPETPQCGYYERRQTIGLPPVVARIWREPELDFLTQEATGRALICCEVNGRRKDPYSEWGYLCSSPIAKAAYDKRRGAPAATEPVDLYTVKPPVFGKPRRRT